MKRICDSDLFKELVSKCLIPKHATCVVVKIWACASLVMTAVTWLLPKCWPVAAGFATNATLWVITSCLWAGTFRYIVRFKKEQEYQQALMEKGKQTFGDDFAAAVQADTQWLL